MGRYSAGERKQVNVRMPITLIAEIDAARGMTSRDAWLAAAAELALRPTSQVTKPVLKEQHHMHVYRQLIATKYVEGKKFRTFRCECGLEREDQI